MKIAYVWDSDTSDLKAWSGIPFFLGKAIRAEGVELYSIDNLVGSRARFLKLKKLAYNLTGRRFQAIRDIPTWKANARVIQSRIQPGTDGLFAPSSLPFAYLDCSIPKFTYTDSTFRSLLNYYPTFSKVCRETIRDGEVLERQAISRVNLAFYASDWAANSAINDYGATSSNVRIVPFGANLETVPSEAEVFKSIQARPSNVCELLFVGGDFLRKGGPRAVDVATHLNGHGLSARLHVVGGDKVPAKYRRPFVIDHGFLNKGDPKQLEVLLDLLRTCHFFILPSEAECAGIAYAEASAFGMPAIARDTGGVSTMVRDGVNGKLFKPDASVKDYAEFVTRTFSSSTDYVRLCKSSRRLFEEELNWKKTSRFIMSEIEACLAKSA